MAALIPRLEVPVVSSISRWSLFWKAFSIMDTARSASVSSARVRTDAAFKNRWQTLFNNPKILVIAFFAS